MPKLQFIIICTLTSMIQLCWSSQNCAKWELSLTQKIENEGFHRELRWLLERSPDSQWSPSECKLALKFDITKEMYLNPDEISELNRLGKLSVLIDSEVDVEVPAHVAEANTAYIFLPSDLEKVSINLPFHLRYQKAQISGGYGKVPLTKPSVLGICPQFCSKDDVEAPCNIAGIDKCKWKNVTYQALFDQVELYVPVGDLDDFPLVSIVTLLLGCAGCIYTLSILSTTPL